MFRATDMFHSIAHFVRETGSSVAIGGKSRAVDLVADDNLGALMPVYSEIARRLSRSTYTCHTVA